MPNHKLLLADDSITIQKVVNLTFADEGIDVISVGDGDSAMDKLREDAPDLVLADVNMPGLNGYEICKKIKTANQNTPVILLVGSFEPFDEDEAKRVGADGYLTKPFQSISQLVSKVNELLNRGQANSINSENLSNNGNEFTVAEEFDSNDNQAFSGFDDLAIDDEMIQTDQIGSVPTDEVTKFETHTLENDNLNLFEDASDIFELTEKSYQYKEEFTETEIKLEDVSFKLNQDLSETQDLDSEYFQTAFENNRKDNTEDLTMPENVSIFELDDLDLLDIPLPDSPEDNFDNQEDNQENDKLFGEDTPDEFAAPEAVFDEISNEQNFEGESLGEFMDESVTENNENVSPYTSTENFETAENKIFNNEDAEAADNNKATAEDEISDAMIETIAGRVVEKLFDKMVKELSREVIPQIAELITKQMAEEKMKD